MTALLPHLPRQAAPSAAGAGGDATPLWTLKPVKPRQRVERVELLARVPGQRLKIQVWNLDGIHGARRSHAIFCVDRFRLAAPAGIDAGEAQRRIAALPWEGRGPDPATTETRSP
jgi:hypothetical protein